MWFYIYRCLFVNLEKKNQNLTDNKINGKIVFKIIGSSIKISIKNI
jgi:hypothetical protein